MDALFNALTSAQAGVGSGPTVDDAAGPDLDMDALFNALSSDQNTAPSNSAVPGPGAGDGAASDGDKSMSQEEIDKLLAEFGLG